MKKLIVIETYGLLTELRGIVGPCLYPQVLDVNIIKKLVDGGKIVKECDPEDPSNPDKRIRLTQRNFNKPNFNVDTTEATTQEVPAVETKEEVPAVETKEEVPAVETKEEVPAVETKEEVPAVEEIKDIEPSVNPDVVVEDNTIKPATEVPTDDFKSNKKKR